MVFKIDFQRDKTVLWYKDGEKTRKEELDDYYPRFYVSGKKEDLFKLRTWMAENGAVATSFEKWYTSLEASEKEKVLRVDVEPGQLKGTVNRAVTEFPRHRYRFYNVSLTPQFRYCLQEEVEPVPSNPSDLSEIKISLPRHRLSKNSLDKLKIDNETVAGSEKEVLKALIQQLERRDPDIIYINRSETLSLIQEKIVSYGLDHSIGRSKGFEKLASENTVSSYGKTVHSNARFNVPGRIIIDESNSFLLGETTVEGLWDLATRSRKPLQELAWGSIGNLLTAIETRKAFTEKQVLTPWKNWKGEEPKPASVLHKADRGGYIFNPEPGIYRDVYEADFASLFPNIMVKKNISPETVGCSCCENTKVPELNYTICEEQRGFIPEVLEPLVEDRQEMKQLLEDTEDGKETRYLRGSADAIKWILVSCFGYMGHAHASYGSIECHQAIQAYDRKIMSETKDTFYSNGYKVVHGIVDSIWVQKRGDAESIEEVCRKVTDDIGIELEYENNFKWIAFVPRKSKNADIGTLNRYFGVKKDGEVKTAGIEAEQRSTPEYIKNCQKQLIKVYQRTESPEELIEVLKRQIERIRSDAVKPEKLVITKRVSKPLESYQQNTRTVNALKRYNERGVTISPGEDVHFLVYNDFREDQERVRLAFEEFDGYDKNFYTERLLDAAATVLSPLGWDKKRVSNRVSSIRTEDLQRYYQRQDI